MTNKEPIAPSEEKIKAMAVCDTSAALTADAPEITMSDVGKLARAYLHLTRQNAAESLPAAPDLEPKKMSRPNLNVGGRKISTASEESQLTPESVHIHYKTLKFMNDALSATHPSEQSSGYRVAQYACSLKCESPVAEPKPTPSTWIACRYCGRLSEGGKFHEQQCDAPISYKPQPDSIPDGQTLLISQIKNLQGMVNDERGQEEVLSALEILLKFAYRDSSSISTEQTFDDWWVAYRNSSEFFNKSLRNNAKDAGPQRYRTTTTISGKKLEVKDERTTRRD